NLKDPQYVIEQCFQLVSGFLPYPPADLEIYFPEHVLLNGLKPFYLQDLEPNQHADLTGLGEFLLLLVDLFGQMEIELDDIVEIGQAGQHFDSSAIIRLGHNIGLEDLQPFAEKLVTQGLAFFEPGRPRVVFLSLLIQPRTGVLPAQPEIVCIPEKSLQKSSQFDERRVAMPNIEQPGRDAFRGIKTAHEELKGSIGKFGEFKEKVPQNALMAGAV